MTPTCERCDATTGLRLYRDPPGFPLARAWICAECAPVAAINDNAVFAPVCDFCDETRNLRVVGVNAHRYGVQPFYYCRGCFTGADDGPCFDDLPTIPRLRLDVKAERKRAEAEFVAAHYLNVERMRASVNLATIDRMMKRLGAEFEAVWDVNVQKLYEP